MLTLPGTFTMTTGIYWISAGVYAFMDFTQKPKFLMKYKIQPDKNVPLDAKLFMKVLYGINVHCILQYGGMLSVMLKVCIAYLYFRSLQIV